MLVAFREQPKSWVVMLGCGQSMSAMLVLLMQTKSSADSYMERFCGCFGATLLEFIPVVSEGRLPVRGVLGRVQVRVRSCVCGLKEVAKTFVLKMQEAEALAQPHPVSPYHQQCTSGDHGTASKSGPPVSSSPRGPVVPAARSGTILQASHAPSKHLEEDVKGAISSGITWLGVVVLDLSTVSLKPTHGCSCLASKNNES
jgi:hypothetical protein